MALSPARRFCGEGPVTGRDRGFQREAGHIIDGDIERQLIAAAKDAAGVVTHLQFRAAETVLPPLEKRRRKPR